MDKVFFALSVIFIIMLIFFANNIDFSQLKSEENVSPLLLTFSNLLLSISMLLLGLNMRKKLKAKSE